MEKKIPVVPLKSWKDSQSNTVYRVGDLPVGTTFRQTIGGPVFEIISYPRSAHTGKRQCKNLVTGKYEYVFCSKKVYLE